MPDSDFNSRRRTEIGASDDIFVLDASGAKIGSNVAGIDSA